MNLGNSLIRKVSDAQYIVDKTADMNTNAKLFLTQKLLQSVDLDAIEQIKNVASLPGIVGDALAMPDMHSGYGFPIGGVAGFDYKTGVVSPGGIGFDIGCGVRLLTTNLNYDDDKKDLDGVLEELFKVVPTGVGSLSEYKIKRDEFLDLVSLGIDYAIDKGFAKPEDKDSIEDFGSLTGKTDYLSQRAVGRGMSQIGTLGSGNHFLEVQYVESVIDKDLSKSWNLNPKQIVIMIHTGSRGFGHQIATDFIKVFLDAKQKYGMKYSDEQLACVPIHSKEGQEYLGSMNAAANYAYVNRQMITSKVRDVFSSIGSKVDILYDVTHNIAKKETYTIDGQKKDILVHRKGATRAFSKGNKSLPEKYLNTGQPVIIPGSMGSFSYVLVGSHAEELSLGSVSHGAGRTMSRSEALKTLSYDKISKELEEYGVKFMSDSKKGIVEEGPKVYKDVSEIVSCLESSNLARGVSRLRPLMVLKG